jgi:DNA-binding beta-propeller fold protein YncE
MPKHTFQNPLLTQVGPVPPWPAAPCQVQRTQAARHGGTGPTALERRSKSSTDMLRCIAMGVLMTAVMLIGTLRVTLTAHGQTTGVRANGHRLHLSHPSGLSVDRAGQIYIADSFNHRVLKLSATGTLLRKWNRFDSTDGSFHQPAAVAVGINGMAYVLDYSENRIDRFSASGRLLGSWGGYGQGPGKFAAPNDLATDAQGNVYVADTINSRVQKFSPAGRFLAFWRVATSRAGHPCAPMGIAVDRAGDVYVAEIGFTTDQYGNIVEASNALHFMQKLSSSGKLLAEWGVKGSAPGQFNDPRGVAVDGHGQVYVADFGNNRIEQFSSNGLFMRQWGPTLSAGNVLHGPADVAVGPTGTIYVADWFNSRIDTISSAGALLRVWS